MARPLNPKLSPDLIAGEALAMVDEAGEFTIPGLAQRMQVSASSLYNHVRGKSDIIELMRGRAVARITLPESGAGWLETIRDIAVEYRRAYAEHPRLIPLFTAYTVRDESTIRMYGVLAEAFTAAGFPPRRTLQAITVLDSFVLGSALDAAAPEDVWDPGEEAGTALRDALQDGLGDPARADQAFEFGLELLLEGFARERPH